MTMRGAPAPVLEEGNLFEHRYPAVVVPPSRRPADYLDAAIDRIQRATGTKVTQEKVYPFEAIAASDGLDSYYTKHSVALSLEPLAVNFAQGRSILGNHDFRTFPYGRTTSGEVRDADQDAPEYEPTFYPKHAAESGLRTTKWMVTEAYIVRGQELNGNKTDSIIGGMEAGSISRISISFLVGQYRCGIDGHNMLSYWGDPWPDPDEGCAHFPGETYDEGVAYAVMEGSQGLEESLVYMNASPSAMLLRKADAMASRGLLDPRRVVAIEERLHSRLPSFERRLYAAAKEAPVTTKKREPDPVEPVAEPVEDPPVDEAPPVEPVETPDPEPTPEPVDAETAESVIAEAERAITRLVVLATRDPQAIAPSSHAAIYNAERSLEQVLDEVESERSVGRDVARTHDARLKLVGDALGREVTVQAIRELQERAEIGDALFEELVKETIANRVGVQSDKFDRAVYGAMLRNSRSVETVKAERDSWSEAKKTRFTGGRQVVPADPRSTPAPSTAPATPELEKPREDNVFASTK